MKLGKYLLRSACRGCYCKHSFRPITTLFQSGGTESCDSQGLSFYWLELLRGRALPQAGGQEGAGFRGVCGGGGWLEVFQPDSWSRHSSASCLPACPPRSLAPRLRERERERDIERKSLSRHGPPAAAVGSLWGMTTVHMVINSSGWGWRESFTVVACHRSTGCLLCSGQQTDTAELRDPAKRGGKDPSCWLAVSRIFFRSLLQCAAYQSGWGGRRGNVFICARKRVWGWNQGKKT